MDPASADLTRVHWWLTRLVGHDLECHVYCVSTVLLLTAHVRAQTKPKRPGKVCRPQVSMEAQIWGRVPVRCFNIVLNRGRGHLCARYFGFLFVMQVEHFQVEFTLWVIVCKDVRWKLMLE